MKKIGIISLFTLVFIFILSGCNHKTEVKIGDETFVLEDATSKNQKICEDLLKSKIHSDKYIFSTFKEREVLEDTRDGAHALYGNVEISTAKVSLGCVVYESGRTPELYTTFPPIITVDGDEVVIEFDASTGKVVYEDLEEAINTLLSYPYASNGYTKTGGSGTDLPKFKKIRYVGETQTEKDKEFCRFVPGEGIYDECYEFVVDGELISTEGEIKELKNYPIMVTKGANGDLMISAGGFRDVIPDDEPEIVLTENAEQSSIENRINGKVDESLLTNKPNNIYFDITGDNTLYYNDEFGFSISLGEEWKGGKIENAYEGKTLASVWLRKKGLKTIGIFIIDNTTYQRVKDSLSSDGDEYIGNNNKYTFQRRIVENGEKLGEYKLHLYDVEEQETIEEVGNINSAFSEFEGYIKECENQITNSRIPDIDGNITNISYLRLNKMNVGNAYKITGTLTYDDNGKTNKKEINCALTLGDYSVFGNTTMYNAFGSITTKSEEEQKCIKSLEKYPIEQMKGDRNTVIDVACFPKDYFGPGFITGYVYTTKYSDLGLRITTPAGWRMMEPDGIFLTKSDKPIFVRKGNRISYFHPTVGEEMEYIEVYEKSKNESLEDIIKNKHLNKGCKVGKDIINYYHQNRVVAPYPGIEIFEPIGMSGGGWEGCIADNESQIDNGRIPRFFESPDKSKYYKLSMMDGCAPGPCSIFGKIELL